MNERLDFLAQLLAAEEHPHLTEDPAYAECLRHLEESPGLRAALAEVRAFNEKHPRLIDLGGLPPESRERIAAVLRQASAASRKVVPLHPWSVRRQFAWAAALVLLLAGMSVISSTIIQNQDPQPPILASSPMDAFHAFVGQKMRSGLSFQHQSTDTRQLVNWLEDQSGAPLALPASLLEKPGRGCAKMRGPGADVYLLCFKSGEQTLHLFTSCAKRLELPATAAPTRFRIEGRETREWSDGTNVFLLIMHEPGEPMPEVML